MKLFTYIFIILSPFLLFSACTSNRLTGTAKVDDPVERKTEEPFEEPQQELLSSERLIARAPSDWQRIFELNNGDTRLSTYIPKGEAEDNWQTKLSFEAHEQLIAVDPISIMMGEISKMDDICSNIDHSNLFSGLENNYPTSVRLILCGQNAHSGKGEVSITKGIQGKDYFYIIRLEKKLDAFEKGKPEFAKNEIAEWSTYLKRITLCDQAPGTTHPCSSDNNIQD
ncbi:MAG: hypothetical protein ACI9CE_003570 [Flavobacterium sp.]|jgi:hypothetical protein